MWLFLCLLVIPNPINNGSFLLVERGYLYVESFVNRTTYLLSLSPCASSFSPISGVGINKKLKT